MVVFGQKWLCSGKSCYIQAKVVVFGQKCLFSGKVLVIRQKCSYSVKNGCVRAKVVVLGHWVVFGQSGFIWAKMVLFGQELLYSG